MNLEIAEQWALELESGEWKQGKMCLRDGDHYCCMGVLAEMAIRSGSVEQYVGEDAGLAVDVMRWSGVSSPLGRIHGEQHRYLAHANDSGIRFPEIAALIRKHAAEL